MMSKDGREVQLFVAVHDMEDMGGDKWGGDIMLS